MLQLISSILELVQGIEVMLMFLITSGGNSKERAFISQLLFLIRLPIDRLRSFLLRGPSIELLRELELYIQLLHHIFNWELVDGCQRIPLLQIFQPLRMDFQMTEVLVIDLELTYLAIIRWHQGMEGFFKSLRARIDRNTKCFSFV